MKKLLKKLSPKFLISWYHWCLAFLGAVIYGWPSGKLKVIGVTGTKGKSTVVYLAGKIFEEAGYNVGWISSLSIKTGEKEVMNPYHMTMPGRFFIQKSLRQMVQAGCEYALVEVTSEGIKQHRHRFIDFAGAVFNNLAPEHIEAHGSYEKYRVAKGELFAATAKNKNSFGVYNLDEEDVNYFLEYPISKKYGVKSGENGKSADINLIIEGMNLTAKGSLFRLSGLDFKTSLLGGFNVYNCAMAIAIAASQGISMETAGQALAKIESIAGRLEIIDEGQDFTVVVDLAHTPGSFEKVFRLFYELPHNRIISVFGSAGGGRDKWKRPELGRIASHYSDQVIITNEDPYDEDPLKIADDILAGCDQNKTDIILDRREAIAGALKMAKTGDILLILGKGTEQTMVMGNEHLAWDDRLVAREELKRFLH